MEDFMIIDIQDASFKVRTFDGGYKEFTVGDIFGVDETDITKEYMQQASLYGFFATAAAMAEEVANRASFAKDQEYAAVDEVTRQKFEMNGVKFTEAVVRSAILLDEKYKTRVMREIKTEYDAKLLKAIARALEQRADMLVSLGSHLRHESSMTGMSIREHELDNMTKSVKSTLRAAKQKS